MDAYPSLAPGSQNTVKHIADRMAFPVLFAIAFSHLLNDTIQSLIPAIYPLVKESYALSFAEVGLITLAFQLTASILQPLVGHWTDRRPRPFALVGGMVFTLTGLLLLAWAGSFRSLLIRSIPFSARSMLLCFSSMVKKSSASTLGISFCWSCR